MLVTMIQSADFRKGTILPVPSAWIGRGAGVSRTPPRREFQGSLAGRGNVAFVI